MNSRSKTALLGNDNQGTPKIVHTANADFSISELTENEVQKLTNLEKIVNSGIRSFISAGLALAVIRDERLFRKSHETFADYCHERWQLDASYAHRLICASKLHSLLSPIGTVKPTSESQIRPLTKLSVEQAKQAWQQAVVAAGNQPPTANQVKLAVSQLKGVSAPKTAKKPQASGSLKKFVAKATKIIAQIQDAIQNESPNEALTGLNDLKKLLENLTQ